MEDCPLVRPKAPTPKQYPQSQSSAKINFGLIHFPVITLSDGKLAFKLGKHGKNRSRHESRVLICYLVVDWLSLSQNVEGKLGGSFFCTETGHWNPLSCYVHFVNDGRFKARRDHSSTTFYFLMAESVVNFFELLSLFNYSFEHEQWVISLLFT